MIRVGLSWGRILEPRELGLRGFRTLPPPSTEPLVGSSVMLDVWVVHPLRSRETGGQPDGPADLFHVPSPDPPGPTHRFAPHHDVLAGVLQ